MKIAIIGCGAIGGYVGARARARRRAGHLHGARREPRSAARATASGSSRATAARKWRVRSPPPTITPRAGPQDVVILAVKAHQLDAVATRRSAPVRRAHRRRDHAERHPLLVFPSRTAARSPAPSCAASIPRGQCSAANPRRAGHRLRGVPGRRAAAPGRRASNRGRSLSGRRARRQQQRARHTHRAVPRQRAPEIAGAGRHPRRDLAQAVGQPHLQSRSARSRARRWSISASSRPRASWRRR